jgi:type I restriction enzyme S subunit
MSSHVPDGWNKSKLGEIAQLTMGQSPSSETYNYEGVGLPFYQGKTDFGAHTPKVRVWCSEPTKVANENSILFTVRAPVGDVNITLTQCCIGRGLAAINGTLADQSFLYQQIQFVKHQFTLLAQGSTFEAVNGSEMREFPLILPPLPEQQKIAQILTSVDEVIEKTQAQIDKLKDLKTAMMQELLTKGIGHLEFKDSPVGSIPVGWDVDVVGNLFHIQLGKMLSKASKVGDSPYPYIGNKNVQWGKVNMTELQCMDFTDRERQKFSLIKGDLLICEGGDVGRSAIWDGEMENCYYQKAIHRLRPIENLYESRLLLDYMKYAKENNLLADFVSRTSIAHLTKEKLAAIPIPFPPITEQREIVKICSSINSKIDSVTEKYRKIVEIKKALMQDLLTGKVRVNAEQSNTSLTVG